MAESKVLKHKYSMRFNDIKTLTSGDGEDKLYTEYTIISLDETKAQEDQLEIEKTKLLHERFHQAFSGEKRMLTESDSISEMLRLYDSNLMKGDETELRVDGTQKEDNKAEIKAESDVIQITKSEAALEEGSAKIVSIEKEELNINTGVCSEERVAQDNTVIANSDAGEVSTRINTEDLEVNAETDSLQLVVKEETPMDSTQNQDSSSAVINQSMNTDEVAVQSDEAITQVKTESVEANFNKEEVIVGKDAEMYKVTSEKETKSKTKSEKRKRISIKRDAQKYKKEESVKTKQSKSIIKKDRANKQSKKAAKAKSKEKVSVTVSQTPSMDISNEIIESEEHTLNDTKDSSMVVRNEQALEVDAINNQNEKNEEKSKVEELIFVGTTATESEKKDETTSEEVNPTQTEIVSEKTEDTNTDLRNIEIKRDGMKGDFGFHLYGKKNLLGHFVSRVEPGTLSDQAGLRLGDRIVKVGDQNVEKMKHMQVVELIKNTNGTLNVSVTNEEIVLKEARENKEKDKDEKEGKKIQAENVEGKLSFISMEEARPKPKKRVGQEKSWKERKAVFKNL